MTLLNMSNVQIMDVVEALSLSIERGERVGLIGESGSGKTITAMSILRLIPSSGSIVFDGTNIQGLSEKQMCVLRGKRISMVFQEPMTALDPLMKVGTQISHAIRIHSSVSRAQARKKADSLLHSVELDPELRSRYPHELSGGQRQRVLIAMALAHDPDLLICDEPTTALDVTSQKAIVDLILRLVAERGTGLLFITHDLGLVARTCERVLVMREGRIIESGTVEDVLKNPREDYTAMLVQASTLAPAPQVPLSSDEVLHIDNVTKKYRGTTAVEDVTLTVHRGERLGIVGGSGSGKTTLLKMISGLSSPTSGHINAEGSMRIVFQDPMQSLDPHMSIADIVSEPLGHRDLKAVERALEEVGLDADMMNRLPHEFSGGQRQRISIARALVSSPDILLADEPVSALDVSVRARVLALLDRLVSERQLTMLFVSHDLHVVRSLCTTVAVMREGKIVEYGATEDVFNNPQHEYTKALIEAIPSL
ncbi:ABC transporter ATP-binding protein [Corynebacterium belfantii]|uniref:ATP-binding cassette domain-containing protein n=1 Tax=Corynebacterium belfantii TaxID=2014537 RepID=UPI0009600D12|nr:ABC transporter ATP-binding protein [Corynebacterium belfantii]OLN15282.1 ABC transporter ATP-binding protein [Corynebacterium diphtheriae subsp. lausannense]MBG9244586.1 ABC transporter ATP-binding protein [Corynebacterium belfantii]MBG9298245.1 ABC transporter ATP-binding protein [Corynebacterium belfantii]MBG9308052.1 ABC transporter ATP-binding protein [Corynebacterium belfantii]MBG9349370.1 ABC transporter ATP-binding protein [Corynebacterium belfantii]